MAIAEHRRVGLSPRIVLPVLLCAGVWLLTGVLWGVLRGQEDRALALAVEEYARHAAEQIEGRAAERLLPFARMAHRWERAGGGDEAGWRADAVEYHADHPELLAIEWVDETSRIRWVEPLEGNEAAVGLELNDEGTRAAARARSTATGMPAMSGVIELVQGGPGVLFFHPLWLGGELTGHLVFVARPGLLVEQLIGAPDERFEVVVYDGDTALWQRGEAGLGEQASAELDVAGVTWRVGVQPTGQTAALYRSHTPAAVLVSGFLLGLAFFVTAYLWLLSRARRTDLQHQSAELQAILDLLPAMVWHKDTQNNILRANAAAARGVGVTPAEMAGQPTAKFYPDTAELFYQGDLEVMRGGVPRLGVVEPIDTDAGRRDVQTDKLPVVSEAGEVTGIIVIATDITHLLAAEAQARAEAERFEAFMRHDPELKWSVDAEGRYLYINPAYEQQMQVRAEDCVGRRPSEVLSAKTTQAFLSVVDETNALALAKGEPIKFEVDVPVAGRVYPLLVTKFMYHDAAGHQIVGGSALDLTAVREAQRELARHNTDLETLLYVISHDLREPLRGIRNFSDLIAAGYAEHLDARGQDMLARIARGADRLDELLSDVLLLSRAQRDDTVDEPIDSAEVVAQVLHDLQPVIEDTGARIAVGEGLPMLRMDRFWLQQAVLNLVSNAIKFTPEGETPDIEIDAFSPGPGPDASDGKSPPTEDPTVGLVVRDRGPGVVPAMREKIFGLFQRGVGRQVEGTGAGLAIVAQVAQRYGGTAWVQDRPGGGAEFVVLVRDQ